MTSDETVLARGELIAELEQRRAETGDPAMSRALADAIRELREGEGRDGKTEFRIRGWLRVAVDRSR